MVSIQGEEHTSEASKMKGLTVSIVYHVHDGWWRTEVSATQHVWNLGWFPSCAYSPRFASAPGQQIGRLTVSQPFNFTPCQEIKIEDWHIPGVNPTRNKYLLAFGCVEANCRRWWKRSSQLMYAREHLGAFLVILLIIAWRPSTDRSAMRTWVTPVY